MKISYEPLSLPRDQDRPPSICGGTSHIRVREKKHSNLIARVAYISVGATIPQINCITFLCTRKASVVIVIVFTYHLNAITLSK